MRPYDATADVPYHFYVNKGSTRVISACGEARAKLTADYVMLNKFPRDTESCSVCKVIVKGGNVGSLPSSKVTLVRLRRLHAAYGGRCAYCNTPLPLLASTIDHIVPRSQGGQDTWDNYALACAPCNRGKKDLRPDESEITAILRKRVA